MVERTADKSGLGNMSVRCVSVRGIGLGRAYVHSVVHSVTVQYAVISFHSNAGSEPWYVNLT